MKFNIFFNPEDKKKKKSCKINIKFIMSWRKVLGDSKTNRKGHSYHIAFKSFNPSRYNNIYAICIPSIWL